MSVNVWALKAGDKIRLYRCRKFYTITRVYHGQWAVFLYLTDNTKAAEFEWIFEQGGRCVYNPDSKLYSIAEVVVACE